MCERKVLQIIAYLHTGGKVSQFQQCTILLYPAGESTCTMLSFCVSYEH